MTLLHMNGHEGAARAGTSIVGTITYGAGRTGQCSRIATSGNSALYFVTQNAATVIIGLAIRFVTNPPNFSSGTTGVRLLRFHGLSGFEDSSLCLEAGGILTVRRGQASNPTVLGTSIGALDYSGGWNYLEVKLTLSDVGSCDVKLNGAVIMSFTGDLKDSASTTAPGCASISVAGNNSSIIEVDDTYVLNDVNATTTQGRPFNDFLGPIRIEPLLPNGAGASSQWIGSDGNSVDNHLLVDETPANTTDYVESSTVGQRDLYEFANPVTATGQVLAVEIVSHSVAPDGGSPKIKSVARTSGGTVAVGPGVVPSTVWSTIADGPMTEDPDGNPWTLATLAAAQFGVELG